MSSPPRPVHAPGAVPVQPLPKVTAPGLRAWKLASTPITALTAYDFITASIVEAAGVDVVLVGDSLANTALGYENTLPVTLEEMLVAVRAVRRGLRRALLVADMPFGSYQSGESEALRAAIGFVKAGAEAVKLEGGSRMASLVARLVQSGIPVMGHIGLTPQSLHAMGGYKVQGRDEEDARLLREDACALQAAGAFSLVLEGIPAPLAEEISRELDIPTIGIGAGPCCDGQILVIADLLGMLDGRRPRFVRQYLSFHDLAVDAVQRYRRDVRDGTFPAPQESYGLRADRISSSRDRIPGDPPSDPARSPAPAR
ncbi:MAG: 3-methyl-2-oxobutanoate hydroxymethyltransferase, partial [Planctomycetes bacterium]|nr:3-methyl-2-oxobutanoate hydroxymethyltransferase [Planctomycetota bacterium]